MKIITLLTSLPGVLFVFIATIFYFTPSVEVCKQKLRHTPPSIASFVINLEQRKDRLIRAKSLLEKLPFPYIHVSAVDGTMLSQEECDMVDFRTYTGIMGNPPISAAIGCSLSHIKAWRAFLDSDHDFALICEDDIAYDTEELTKVVLTLIKHDELWDIVNLENQLPSPNIALMPLQNDKKLVLFFVKALTASCYLINRKVAKRLLDNALPIKRPVDLYFNRTWELQCKFCGVLPNVAKQNGSLSTIEGSKLLMKQAEKPILIEAKTFKKGKKRSLSYVLKKALPLLISDVMRFIYSLKIYLHIIYAQWGH